MGARRFDRLVRSLSTPGSRRGLLTLLAVLPLGGLLASLLEESEAKGRHKRRVKRHKHGKGKRKENRKGKLKAKRKKKRCTPESAAQTCAGKCATVINTCQQAVDCGPCPCNPACPVCQTCNAATGQCIPNAAVEGQPCGSPGQICQSGICVQGCLPPTADLQAAIAAADPESTLTLCAGTWNLGETVAIAKDLTLLGAGAGQTILDGNNAVQVLKIATGTTVTLERLTITKGSEHNGGGIYNDGTMTLRDVAVIANFADNAGGGIFSTGDLTLQDGSRVVGNSGPAFGAWILTTGTLTLEAGSTVGGVAEEDANTARLAGGGIFNAGSTVTLKNGSRVIGNSAPSAAGIFNQSNDHPVAVEAGALVCDNTPLLNQCGGSITGACPNPSDGECRA